MCLEEGNEMCSVAWTHDKRQRPVQRRHSRCDTHTAALTNGLHSEHRPQWPTVAPAACTAGSTGGQQHLSEAHTSSG